MKVLVTGGCGFIGSHVVDVLVERNHEVLVLDNMVRGKNHWIGREAGVRISKVDITDGPAFLAAAHAWSAGVLFHLAADHFIPQCEANPEAAYELNVCGTLHALKAAQLTSCERFFLASTADVYPPSDAAHVETDGSGPFTVYGRTKLACEYAVSDMRGKLMGRHTLIGRLFNAVGARETNPHIAPEVARQLLSGSSTLRLGNLTPTRDFVDVRAMAEAIVDATFAARGMELLNIGSGESITVAQMVDRIVSAHGRRVEIVVDPSKVRPAERQHLKPDVSRLRKLIGYAPRSAGEETIRQMLTDFGRV